LFDSSPSGTVVPAISSERCKMAAPIGVVNIVIQPQTIA
jgi:hypothetical protein